jgi:hypothetical protein
MNSFWECEFENAVILDRGRVSAEYNAPDPIRICPKEHYTSPNCIYVPSSDKTESRRHPPF